MATWTETLGGQLYSFESFTTTGSSEEWTVPAGVTSVDVLLVAGGGGGARQGNGGGAGGAGELVWETGYTVTPAADIPVNVGAGGAGGSSSPQPGGDGGNSDFDGTLIALGGGGGGAGTSGTPANNGRPGGSGGAGSGCTATNPSTGGASTASQGVGHNGGAGGESAGQASRNGGGGGGAGSAGTGANVAAQDAGDGGAGYDASTLVGTTVGEAGWFASGGGGGAGGAISHRGNATAGGGGLGAYNSVAAGEAGAANTGGGGGGGRNAAGNPSDGPGGNGGSGIVIVRWIEPEAPGVPTEVAVTDTEPTSLTLSWEPPATGTATGYEVRLNGGTPTDAGDVLTHEFTGLTPETSYDLEVRAYGPGGESDWVLVTAETDPAGPSSGYVADIRIGAHTWECVFTDTPGTGDPNVPNVLAGATFTWSAPQDKGWPPAVAVMPLDTCSLQVLVPAAEDVADVALYDTVRFKFTPVGYTVDDPLVDFAGIITSNPTIVDHPGGGAVLQVTAADWRVALSFFTVFGTDDEDGGQHNAEPSDGVWNLLAITQTPYIALQGDGDDWGGSSLWIDEAITLKAPPFLPSTIGDIFDGTSIGPASLPAYSVPSVTYEYPDDLVTLDEVYRALQVYPMPNYDDDGDLVSGAPYRYVEVESDGSDYTTADPIDACLIPNPTWQWQRGYVPNYAEVMTGGDPPFLATWTGAAWEDDFPLPPERKYLVRVSPQDHATGRFNQAGFMASIPEASEWGLPSFTVMAHLEPLAVEDWFVYPHRVRRYVTVDGIAADKDPTGVGEVAGMLGGAQLVVGERGKWWAVGFLRPSHPGPPPEA